MNTDRRHAMAALLAGGLAAGAATSAKARDSDVEKKNIETALRYTRAILNFDADALAELLADDFEVIEYPNLVVPNGQKRGREGALKGIKVAQQILSEQTYEVTNIFATGDLVVFQALWSGRLKIAFDKFGPGLFMKAECAGILRFREGKLVSQHEYDCYHPFG